MDQFCRRLIPSCAPQSAFGRKRSRSRHQIIFRSFEVSNCECIAFQFGIWEVDSSTFAHDHWTLSTTQELKAPTLVCLYRHFKGKTWCGASSFFMRSLGAIHSICWYGVDRLFVVSEHYTDNLRRVIDRFRSGGNSFVICLISHSLPFRADSDTQGPGRRDHSPHSFSSSSCPQCA
jgi:hypothetical protein